MINCPHCKGPLRLLKGDRYWVHENDKLIGCPITSIPNYPSLLQKLCGNRQQGSHDVETALLPDLHPRLAEADGDATLFERRRN